MPFPLIIIDLNPPKKEPRIISYRVSYPFNAFSLRSFYCLAMSELNYHNLNLPPDFFFFCFSFSFSRSFSSTHPLSKYGIAVCLLSPFYIDSLIISFVSYDVNKCAYNNSSQFSYLVNQIICLQRKHHFTSFLLDSLKIS